jgi:hypothetical protein
MCEMHEFSFFGQKAAIIFSSGKYDGPIFFHFLKKKENGDWEKPSLKEGIVFTLGILEIKKLLDHIQYKSIGDLTYVHAYKGNTNTLKIKIDYSDAMKISFMVGDHAKPLMYPESAVFEDLLRHIYKEKLEIGTEKTFEKKESSEEKAIVNTQESKGIPMENPTPQKTLPPAAPAKEGEESRETFIVVRRVSAKALFIEIPSMNNAQIWAPKSKILSSNPGRENEINALDVNQEITVKIPSWILDK